MSKINCPECGFLISDNINKCPKCKFPLGKFTNPQYIPDDNNYDFITNAFVNLDSGVTYSQIRKKILNRKMLKYGGVCLTAFVIVIAAIIFIINFNAGTGGEVNIQELSAGRLMKLNGEYVVNFTSNETRPFVTVVKDLKYGIYDYVYMNEGNGSLIFNIIDDETENNADEDFEVAGYFTGYPITNDNIDNISNKTAYYNYIESAGTACKIDYEITLKNKLTGILFYDISCDVEHKEKLNRNMVVIDGVGRESCILDGLPYRTSDIKAEFEPLYFVPATELEESDYSVSRPFETSFSEFYDYENEYLGYYIYGDINVPDRNRGLILYDYSLKNHDASEYMTEKNGLANVENESCSVMINDSVITYGNSELYDYSVNIRAYINWNDAPTKKDKKEN